MLDGESHREAWHGNWSQNQNDWAAGVPGKDLPSGKLTVSFGKWTWSICKRGKQPGYFGQSLVIEMPEKLRIGPVNRQNPRLLVDSQGHFYGSNLQWPSDFQRTFVFVEIPIWLLISVFNHYSWLTHGSCFMFNKWTFRGSYILLTGHWWKLSGSAAEPRCFRMALATTWGDNITIISKKIIYHHLSK